MIRTTNHFKTDRFKKIAVAIFMLLAVVMFGVSITGTNAYAEGAGAKDLSTSLIPYTQELEKINSELGADFTFASEDELTDEQFDHYVNFYRQMTIEEFRDYVYDMYQFDTNSSVDLSLTAAEVSVDKADIFSVNPTSIITQKYYYNFSDNYNYIQLKSEVMYGGGRAIYIDIISWLGYIDDEDDYYDAFDSDYELSSDQSSVDVTFYCTHYRKGLALRNIVVTVKFEAAGGDVYKTHKV